MRKLLIILFISIIYINDISAQVEYKVFTSVESIVPNGIGRSRIISANEDKDYKDYTSTQRYLQKQVPIPLLSLYLFLKL